MNQQKPFHQVSRKVMQRLFLARVCSAALKSTWIVFPVLIALALIDWYTGKQLMTVPVAIGFVIAWAFGTTLFAMFTAPTPVAALAYFDSRTNRQEVFTSAYCFEDEPTLTTAHQLHLRKAERELAAVMPEFQEKLPVPFQKYLLSWLLPGLFTLLVGWLQVVPALSMGPVLNQEDARRAAEIAEVLEKQKVIAGEAKELTEAEQKQLQELEDALEETAGKLKNLDSNSQKKDVLAELERRAREAEKLAEQLSDAGEALSSDLLNELEKHVDTTDLASAMKSKDLEKTGEEARKLDERLNNQNLTLDEQSRIERALTQAMEKANPDDLQTAAGQNFQQAEDLLKNGNPKSAGEEFGKLAARAAEQLQRQQIQKKLEQLAQQLRQSGQKIFDQEQQGMRQLSKLDPLGMNKLRSIGDPLRNSPMNQQMNPLQNNPLGQPNQNTPPGQGQQPQNQNPADPNQLAQANPNAIQNNGQIPVPGSQPPIPGTAKQPGQGQPPVPGEGQPGQGQPPIPGTQPGQGQPPIPGQGQQPGQGQGQQPGQGQGQQPGQGQQAGQGQGQGQQPGQGQGQQPGQGSGNGGLEAGEGSAAYANNTTKPLTPTGSSIVNTQMNQEGSSQIRQVEGDQQRENSRRAFQKQALQQVQAEEEALEDEVLPFSRREQVRRYFEAVRSQLSE